MMGDTLTQALDQAKALRQQTRSALDAKVRRVHDGGSYPEEIGQALGVSAASVRKSLKRMGLTPNAPVRLTPRKLADAKKRRQRRA